MYFLTCVPIPCPSKHSAKATSLLVTLNFLRFPYSRVLTLSCVTLAMISTSASLSRFTAPTALGSPLGTASRVVTSPCRSYLTIRQWLIPPRVNAAAPLKALGTLTTSKLLLSHLICYHFSYLAGSLSSSHSGLLVVPQSHQAMSHLQKLL